MKTAINKKILKKRIIIFLIMWFIAISLLIIGSIINLYLLKSENIYLEQEKYVSTFIKDFNKQIINIENKLSILINKDEIINFLSSKQKEKFLVNQILEISKEITGSSIVYLMNIRGDVVGSSTYGYDKKTLLGKNYIFRPYFLKALERKSVIYPALGVTTLKRGLYISRPIYNKNKKNLLGVLVFKRNMADIDKLLKNPGSIVMLVSPENVIFASSNRKWLFYSLYKLSSYNLEKIYKTKQFAGKKIQLVPWVVKEGKARINNDDYFVFRKKLSIPGWKIVMLYKNRDLILTSLQKNILITVLLLGTGLITIIIIFIYDILKRKSIEKELTKSENTFKIIFENSFQFISLLDITGKLLKVNKAGLSTIGFEQTGIIGKFYWETPWWKHSLELQQKVKDAVKEAVKGKSVRFLATNMDKNNNLLDIDFNIKPVIGEQNHVLMLIAEIRDRCESNKK